VRQIIVEEDMDHPLIGRPVLDEMDFVESQHLDSVRDKFHMHDFSHIGEKLLEMGTQPLGALSKLLLMPADIPEFIKDLPIVLAGANKKNMKRREQAKLHALDEDQSKLQQGEHDDGDHDVLQSNVKFASLKEQALLYGDIPDDDPIDYHDVDVGQGNPEELVYVQGWCTEFTTVGDRVQGRFQAQAWRRPSCECESPCNKAARRCRTRADVSSQVRSAAAEVHALQDTRARRAGLGVQEHWSRVGESSAHPSEARARPVSHDCRSACTERVDEANCMAYV
jgi:hypothetical protein